MTLVIELKKELRKVEQTRKEFETKVVTLKQKEARIRQLAAEFTGSSAALSSAAHRPLSEEHRRKISEALKRRHSQSKNCLGHRRHVHRILAVSRRILAVLRTSSVELGYTNVGAT